MHVTKSGVNTDMKARTLRRHLNESLRSIGRNGWMTFASVSAVTVTLLLVGIFLVLMMNLNKVADDIENDVEIRVHIDVAASQENQQALKKEIEAIPGVKSIGFSPKEKELDDLMTSLGEDGKVFAMLEQDNPLNDVFIVKAKDPQDTMEIAKKIEKMDFAFKVKYGQGTVEKLFSFIDVARNVGLVLVAGLLFTAMFLISNTIKITILARKREIEIMRLVGATNSFIRWPFFLEGLWLGILGSIIPIVLIAVIYNYALDYAQPRLTGHFIQILEFSPFIFQVSGILVLLGAFIGVWGSLMSVRKFLKI